MRARSIKHRLNNLLMALMGHAEILLDMKDLPEAVRAKAEAIMAQAHRVGEEVKRLDHIAEPEPEGSDADAGGSPDGR